MSIVERERERERERGRENEEETAKQKVEGKWRGMWKINNVNVCASFLCAFYTDRVV